MALKQKAINIIVMESLDDEAFLFIHSKGVFAHFRNSFGPFFRGKNCPLRGPENIFQQILHTPYFQPLK